LFLGLVQVMNRASKKRSREEADEAPGTELEKESLIPERGAEGGSDFNQALKAFEKELSVPIPKKGISAGSSGDVGSGAEVKPKALRAGLPCINSKTQASPLAKSLVKAPVGQVTSDLASWGKLRPKSQCRIGWCRGYRQLGTSRNPRGSRRRC
jgi:hypothetical protein